jgi:uncharacterized protein YggE
MVKERYLSLLVICVIPFCSFAEDRIVPLYPGSIIIDSDEQAETEKRVRMQAIENAKARAKEGANASDPLVPSYSGSNFIDSLEQAETERRVRMQAIEDAKARAKLEAEAEGSEVDTKANAPKTETKTGPKAE